MKSSKEHINLKIGETGLHVLPTHPYIGASPDLLVECSCHGKGIVEIKCPFSICETVPVPDNYVHVDSYLHLKTTSPYYFQVQGQMGVLSVEYYDFLYTHLTVFFCIGSGKF